MKCIACDEVITNSSSWRKLAWCSFACRNKIYHDKYARDQILDGIRNNNYKKLGSVTVSRLIDLGFKVLIFEREPKKSEVIEKNAS